MARKIQIGGENEGSQRVFAADGVRVVLDAIEDSTFRPGESLRFGFQITDPDYDNGVDEDQDALIHELTDEAYVHWENVNLPQGQIGKRTKLYKFLAGMSGGEFDEDAEVDLDQFEGGEYLADFELVDKMAPDGSGGFRIAQDDRGRSIKKTAVTKLRPVKKSRKKAGKVAAPPPTVPDDDDDLDFEPEDEEVA